MRKQWLHVRPARWCVCVNTSPGSVGFGTVKAAAQQATGAGLSSHQGDVLGTPACRLCWHPLLPCAYPPACLPGSTCGAATRPSRRRRGTLQRVGGRKRLGTAAAAQPYHPGRGGAEDASAPATCTHPSTPLSRCGRLHMRLPPLLPSPAQDHDVYKQRLAANGSPVTSAEKHNVDATQKAAPPTANVTHDNGTVATVACGSCYGAEEKTGDCCNTCDEVGRGRERGHGGG